MKSKEKKPRAPPVRYSQELGDRICDRLAGGEPLRAICRNQGMPDERAVRLWANDPEHPFAPQYARAREIGYHKMADEIIEIADDASNDYAERENRDGENVRAFDPEHVQRARLRVEARKWLLSKALPKVYGDRLNIDAKITTQDEFAKTLEASRAAINGNAEVSH